MARAAQVRFGTFNDNREERKLKVRVFRSKWIASDEGKCFRKLTGFFFSLKKFDSNRYGIT